MSICPRHVAVPLALAVACLVIAACSLLSAPEFEGPEIQGRWQGSTDAVEVELESGHPQCNDPFVCTGSAAGNYRLTALAITGEFRSSTYAMFPDSSGGWGAARLNIGFRFDTLYHGVEIEGELVALGELEGSLLWNGPPLGYQRNEVVLHRSP